MKTKMIRANWLKGLGLMAGAIALLGVSAAAASAQSDAAKIYNERCASCHGANGQGDGPAAKALKPPPSNFAKSLPGKTDDWIAKAITQGGAAVGESPVMPPYKDLSSDQVNGLVSYIKQFAKK